jgi:tRNA (uracil-5-)-methyltransferase TRM9
MIYVWALEQKSSRRGWDATSEQDVMVPWVTREGSQEVTYHRYYHLFRKGELENCVGQAGGRIIARGYERVFPRGFIRPDLQDNWWVIVQRDSQK